VYRCHSLAAEITDYLAYVRDPACGYLSISFPQSDGPRDNLSHLTVFFLVTAFFFLLPAPY
jgi:hypothetical protein